MTSFYQSIVHISVTLLLIFITTAITRKSYHACPIGFDLAFNQEYGNICYRIKGPESFEDKFLDCAGNLYSSTLYHKLNITETKYSLPVLKPILWADYKSVYSAGPYIDLSHTNATGDILPTSTVKYDSKLLDEELCVVIDPVVSFTTAKCNEKHYRYCFVKPYSTKQSDMSKDGCEDSWRFWSPRPTCLMAPVSYTSLKRGTITWWQAKEMCANHGQSLLGKGWIYANNPLIPSSLPENSNYEHEYPLGVILSSDKASLTGGDDSEITAKEWDTNSWNNVVYGNNMSLMAIRDTHWFRVYDDDRFYEVICEKSVQLKSVTMNLSVDLDKIILYINDTMNENDVFCFTDSSTYYPIKVRVKYDEDSNIFVLNPVDDGYYWCTHIDTINYHISESNKALFIRDKESLVNYYAIQLHFGQSQRRFHSLENYRYWQQKLGEYIFYNTRYIKTFGKLQLYDKTLKEILEQLNATDSDLKWKEKEVIYKIKVKRYVEGSAALFHVQLNPEMLPVSPGFWDDIRVQFMKPVYFCKAFDSVPTLSLGDSMSVGHRIDTCEGDFNKGVQWVTNRMSGNDEGFTSTMEPLSPEEQVDLVMVNLESLLQNETAIITLENISETMDQADHVLERLEESKIPGNFLHLLDQLGGRIDLNGSHTGAQIRSNLALLVADAAPETPVKGLRIAASDNDMFTEAAFEMLSEEVNSTHLTSKESEAVVHLPQSVARSKSRITFVVFRNDRSFQTNHKVYTVNSIVLSINVENLTQFEQREFIDIHLSPLMEDPGRNMSRACAYWHFLDDDTGYWSQEGCTLIRSRQKGVLDICRCDHLTHFAEILVPRAVFTERNENVLEILTIIGCCFSVFGLCMVGLTAVLFRSWRRDYSNKIWLQLCISIFILILCFLTVVFAKFDQNNVLCMLFGVGLHYSVLASFCWMLVAAVLSYRKLVTVLAVDPSHKLLRASAFSWGAPCAVVGILFSVDPHSYGSYFEEKTPSGAFCYPSGLGLWLAVYVPVALMLITNWVLFVLIIRSVFAPRKIQRHGGSNEAVRCATVSCLLVFLFGLPWIFGLFAYNIVAAYLFTLTATYQGFVLFLFFVVGNKKTRNLWQNELKTWEVALKCSTSTHTSTGLDVRLRADPGGASLRQADSGLYRLLVIQASLEKNQEN